MFLFPEWVRVMCHCPFLEGRDSLAFWNSPAYRLCDCTASLPCVPGAGAPPTEAEPRGPPSIQAGEYGRSFLDLLSLQRCGKQVGPVCPLGGRSRGHCSSRKWPGPADCAGCAKADAEPWGGLSRCSVNWWSVLVYKVAG